MQIFVKLANSNTISISCSQDKIFEEINNQIQSVQGDCSAQFSLVSAGKALTCESQLQNGSVVE